MTQVGLRALDGLLRSDVLANLDMDYTVLKCKHIGNHWNYIYKLPLNNYAVVQYEDDCETIIYSSFHFECGYGSSRVESTK